MPARSLKGNRSSSGSPAANFAKFPLGSLESRAVARSLAKSMEPSEDDVDAITLYRGSSWVTFGMRPNYADLAATAAFRRGRALIDAAGDCAAVNVKADPLPMDAPRLDVSRSELMAGVLRFLFEKFIEAWQRQIPELPCPLRINDGRIEKRLKHNIWEPYIDPLEKVISAEGTAAIVAVLQRTHDRLKEEGRI